MTKFGDGDVVKLGERVGVYNAGYRRVFFFEGESVPIGHPEIEKATLEELVAAEMKSGAQAQLEELDGLKSKR